MASLVAVVLSAVGLVASGTPAMAATGSISGTVRFVDGEPLGLGEATISLFKDGQWSASASTRDDGTYTLTDLEPGTYQVGFDPAGHELEGEYFHGAASRRDATPVVVGSGQAVTGVDADLDIGAIAEVRLNGTVGTPSLGVEIVLGADPGVEYERVDGETAELYSADPAIYLAYNVHAGAAGRVLVGRASADTPYVRQYYVQGGQTTSSYADASLVTFRESADNIVDMTLRTGAQVTGVVRNADGTPDAGDQVVAWPASDASAIRYTTTNADGSYVIRGLLPGAYKVYVPTYSGAPNYRELDYYYLTGTEPDTANVGVTGTATTSGIDITVGTRFTDVQPTYSFASYISWLAGKGISTGYAQPDGSWQFKPTTPVSREAMAAFLYRDIAAPGYTPPASARFSDVPTSYPFYTNVAWLAQQGISTGYADGTFKPTDAVTREAMAAFLYRAAGSPAYTPPASPRFSDVPTDYPFYTQVSWLAAQGISTGYADGTFKPTAPVTREAMAAFLQRADPIFHPVG